MIRRLLASFLMFSSLWTAGVTHAAGPHVHGTAKIQIAIDGDSMEVELISPMESLVGFERAPRNDSERKAVQNMMDLLKNPAAWLLPAAAAQCKPSNSDIHAPALDTRAKSDKKSASASQLHDGEHAELEAVISYRCAVPAALRNMEVRLFDAFPRLKQLRVEVAIPGKQAAATLDRERRTLSW